MPLAGPVPAQLLTIVAAATLATIMFEIGLGIVPGEFRWVLRRYVLVAKALFSVLIVVPAIALAVVQALELPRDVQIGIVLMAIAPGAPIALRRSLDAGGHRAFASALQMSIAVIAAVSMPLSIAALNHLYVGHARIAPGEVAAQVFTAQLMPLGAGMLVRHFLPGVSSRLEVRLGQIGTILLAAFAVLALVDIYGDVLAADGRAALAIALITALALTFGHLLGGPDAGTRTAVAISTAARNPGLAFLVASMNTASNRFDVTIIVYLVISALVLLPYVIWRRHAAQAFRPARSSSP
jgi:BASS family bile acid:Na+ symporter